MEDDKFLKLLLQTFTVEAQEHLAAMSQMLLQLERNPPPGEAAVAVETLFREAHSLKGASRSVNLADIERVCQPMERVLSALKRGELATSAKFFTTMYASIDGLGRLLSRDVGTAGEVDAGLPASLSRSLLDLVPGGTGPPLAQVTPSVAAVASAVTMPHASPLGPAVTPAASDSVRVATAKLDALMTQSQELHALKFSGAHLADDVQAIGDMLAAWRRGADKRSRHARLLRRSGAVEDMANAKDKRLLEQLLDALDADDLFVRSLCERLGRHARAVAQERRTLGTRVDRLLDDMKQMSMLPFSSLFASAPKMVRDLAHDSGKEVDLQIEGASLEVDRRILEQMKTPLTHLIRNAVDHGIEMPEERHGAGKPRRGRILIAVSARDGNRVEIAISDDGAGIALDKVRSRAQKMGLRTESALSGMDEVQIGQLVFESGLSTSSILTDLSGHGLGLAIVREKVDALGGSIAALRPEGGVGTRFLIVLPATLSTFRGVLVQAGDRPFVFPSRHVERVLRLLPENVLTEDGHDSIRVDGAMLPLVSLAATLGVKARSATRDRPRHVQIIVVAGAGGPFAFAVDEVIGDQEVLVQPLAPPLRRVPNIAAATVLGAGQVVPLLNMADLVKSATLARGGRVPSWRSAQAPNAGASLLVADDSITSRTRLRDILESAGYRVTTAADGAEALASLQSGEFDLLVTDAEMPRLDGFGLTARVRRDKRLAELPIILVTALDTREDKERGVEAGANAYIVKHGFDQRRLLDTIRTLL
jgi:two-component system chemotaxis sensor kinase CheA